MWLVVVALAGSIPASLTHKQYEKVTETMKSFDFETLQHCVAISLKIAFCSPSAKGNKSFVFHSFSIERIKRIDIAYWACALFALNNTSSMLYPEFALFGLSYHGIKNEYYALKVVIVGVTLGITVEAKS